MTMKDRETISTLQSALRDNPECRLGLMARERVAYLSQGVNSFEGNIELLTLISAIGDWYGYVTRVNPEILVHKDQGDWFAMLVCSVFPVEGATDKDVFLCVKNDWYARNEFHTYYTPPLAPEDGMVQCHTFHEAVEALCRIIRRFEYRERMRSEPGKGLEMDMRCLNFFARTGMTDHEVRVMHGAGEFPILAGVCEENSSTHLSGAYL